MVGEGEQNNKSGKMLSDKSVKPKRTAESSEETRPKKKFKDGDSKPGASGTSKDFKKKFIGKKKFPQKNVPQTQEKPNWNDMKTKKKELKIQRKKNRVKDLYEISVKAKKLYEELKQKNSKDNKEQLARELHDIMKTGDSYSKLVFSHDIARVVQCLLKKAPVDVKAEIAEKLVPQIFQLCTSKYGHFCVSRMMIYCGKDVRKKVIDAMFSNIVKLSTHAFSNSIIDSVYLTHATPEQKNFMKQEFYTDLYKNDKNKKVEKLKDTWEGSSTLKTGILKATKTNLIHCANKNFVDNSLIHTVLLEFLEECDENDRNEIIAAFSPHLAQLASTKDGSRSCILCYLHSVAKERRAMLKALKEHVEKLAVHEFGHEFLLTILNSTDDTQMIKKQIFPSIVSNIYDIVNSNHGKKVVEFLMCPGDKNFFHPQVIASLNECLKYGKKDAAIRQSELFANIEESFCDAITEKPQFWLKGGRTGLVTFAILKNLKHSKLKDVYSSLAEVIVDTEWQVLEKEVSDSPPAAEKEEKNVGVKIKKKKKNPFEKEPKIDEDNKMVSGIEHSGLHFALKKIAKLDKDKAKEDLPTIGQALVEKLNSETIEFWIPFNRACFFMADIYENGNTETKEQLKELLKDHFKTLKEQQHAGSKVLMEKFKAK